MMIESLGSFEYDKKFMDEAYRQAQIAANEGEIPIGAVVVCDGKIISRGRNSRQKTQCATRHAEVVAIDKACKKLKSWRLENCAIYVTVEPCVMCYGAMMNARIPVCFFGADGEKGGTQVIYNNEKVFLNWKTQLIKAEGEERCLVILKEFFEKKR